MLPPSLPYLPPRSLWSFAVNTQSQPIFFVLFPLSTPFSQRPLPSFVPFSKELLARPYVSPPFLLGIYRGWRTFFVWNFFFGEFPLFGCSCPATNSAFTSDVLRSTPALSPFSSVDYRTKNPLSPSSNLRVELPPCTCAFLPHPP